VNAGARVVVLVTRPEGDTSDDGDDPAYPLERHRRKAGQKGVDPMKKSTLSQITASVAVAKAMARTARQGVKLDRSEAIRRLVELGLKAKK